MKTSWDLTHFYKNKEEWTISIESLKEEIKKYKEIVNKIDQDINKWKVALEQKIKVDKEIEKAYCYPKRFVDLNNQDEEHQEMVEIAWKIYEEIQKVSQDFIKKISQQENSEKEFVNAYPYYKRYIEIIKKEHNSYLQKEWETIKSIYRNLTENDMKFGTLENEQDEVVKLTRKNYHEFMTSQKESVRKNAFEKMNEAYKNIENTLAILLVRKYQLEVEKAKNENLCLKEQIVNDLELPKNIIDNIINTANKYIDVGIKYTNFKKEILDMKKFHVYDTALPIGLISKMKIPFETGIEEIKESLKILGETYEEKIKKAFEEGWVDVYPRENKRKMSYSCISYNAVPYASLNYNDTLMSVRTLAHELGHSIHTSFAKENPFEYFEYNLFLAEVVSKVNEILFNEHMLKKEIEEEEKIYLLNNIIASLGNTLFNQVMLTEFEQDIIDKIEKGKTLNAESINEIYLNVYQKYNQDSIIIDTDISNSWTKIPHLFMNNAYYLYQYTVGVSLAIEIVKRINEDPQFKEKYINFLKIGNNLNISDSLKALDINLENIEFLENAYLYLKKEVDLLQKLTKKAK